jgi:hypothetical protein
MTLEAAASTRCPHRKSCSWPRNAGPSPSPERPFDERHPLSGASRPRLDQPGLLRSSSFSDVVRIQDLARHPLRRRRKGTTMALRIATARRSVELASPTSSMRAHVSVAARPGRPLPRGPRGPRGDSRPHESGDPASAVHSRRTRTASWMPSMARRTKSVATVLCGDRATIG